MSPKLLPLLAICFTLAGCGQMGPLYLPETETRQPAEQEDEREQEERNQ